MRKYAERINEKITDGETSFVMGNHSMSVQRLESLGRFIIGREGFRVEDNPTKKLTTISTSVMRLLRHLILTASMLTSQVTAVTSLAPPRTL